MTAAALVAELRARGVELIPAGDRIRYRPASAVPPDLVARLRACKAEVLCLLTVPPATVTLDPVTVSEVLGADADDPHAVACVKFDVLAAVREIETGIRAGVLPARRLIHGRPLADWLALDDVAPPLAGGGPPGMTGRAPQVGADRPRLLVVEQLEVETTLDPYLTLRALATYSGCSVRWLRDRLVGPAHPLPCFRLPGGKVLVRRGHFDQWVSAYQRRGDADVDGIVNDMLRSLRPA